MSLEAYFAPKLTKRDLEKAQRFGGSDLGDYYKTI
jgi:hypothetical protein